MIKEQIIRPNWERVVAIFWMLLVFVLVVLAITCLSACTPYACKKVPITITSHPLKPRPSGRVTIGCDGKVVADILADEVEL